MTAYADFFRFPWLRYRVDAPSSGHDYWLGIEYKPSKTLLLTARFHEKLKSINGPGENLHLVLPGKLRHIRFELTYNGSAALQLNSRVEISAYDLSNTTAKGFLAYQEISYKLSRQKIKLTVRYTLFDIDDYNARIYTYEDNVSGAFSIPAFQHRGSRYFVLAKYRLSRHYSFAARFARTTWLDQDSSGTGNDRIMLPHRSEILFQLLSSY
jgi:hypothetical protein